VEFAKGVAGESFRRKEEGVYESLKGKERTAAGDRGRRERQEEAAYVLAIGSPFE